MHLAREGRLDLALDLVAIEEGNGVLVELQLALVVRHHLGDEIHGLLVDLGIVDDDLADVVAEIVAQGANDDVAFLVDQLGRLGLLGRTLDRVPEGDQVIQVPLQLFDAAADAGRAHDDAHALADIELGEGLANLGPIVALDAAGDPAGTRVVGHEHEVAPGETHEGGQRRALVAAFFLLDLDQDFLAFLHRVLDAGAAVGFKRLFREVAAGDFLERQEAMALGAIVDECRFEGGFNPGDNTLVDIGLLLFAGQGLDV